MRQRNNNGESEETRIKQQQFAGFLDFQMTAARSVMVNPAHHWVKKDYYQYFDLYAGKGTWGDGEPGSPLIFLQAIEKHDLPYHAILIEQDIEKVEQLRDVVPQYHKPFCEFLHGDNIMVMRPWLRASKEKPRMGLIYADPYGSLCWNLLSWLSRVRTFERTDMLTYFSANRGLKGPRRRFPDKFEYFSVYLDAIEKKKRLVRRPRTNFEWVFVYLTNWARVPQWEAKHWYDLDTTKGREVLYVCNFTASEREYIEAADTPSLFDL